MGTYPTAPRSAFLEWARTHADVFVSNASQIGLTAAQAQAFKADAAAAEAAANEQAQAAQSAKIATQIANDKVSQLRTRARATVGLIKGFATSTNNMNVYSIAEIPAPVDPSSVPPPAQPTDMKVMLEPTSGALTITWKAANPVGSQGTSYIIKRRTSPTAQFEFIGVTGSKKFVDSTFAAGPDMVQYTVQGQRSDSAGPVSNIVVVNFGVPPTMVAGASNATALSYSIGPVPSPESQSPARLAA